MRRQRSGSDTSSNGDDAPPTLFVRPAGTKRTARALSPKRAPSPAGEQDFGRNEAPRSPRSPQRKRFAPGVLDVADAALIPVPPDWKPPVSRADQELEQTQSQSPAEPDPVPPTVLLSPSQGPSDAKRSSSEHSAENHEEVVVKLRPRHDSQASSVPDFALAAARASLRSAMAAASSQESSHAGSPRASTSHTSRNTSKDPNSASLMDSVQAAPHATSSVSSASSSASPRAFTRAEGAPQASQTSPSKSPRTRRFSFNVESHPVVAETEVASRPASRSTSPAASPAASALVASPPPKPTEQLRSPRARSPINAELPRKLRFATPLRSDSPLPSSPSRLHRPSRLTSSPSHPRAISLNVRPIPDLRSDTGASEPAVQGSPKLTSVPNLAPSTPTAAPCAAFGNSSPYGAQRSPQKKAELSPERPLTMQMHYLLARENSDEGAEHGNGFEEDETLSDALVVFGNKLEASGLVPKFHLDGEGTLETVETPVLWRAIRELHARGSRLLAEVLEQRERRVPLTELAGGYGRFSALEKQGVESAIVERQKQRCLSLRARATEVQQLYLELRDRVWSLERQKAEADLLEAQIGASASALAEVEELEAQAAAEEIEVSAAEARIQAVETEWQEERADVSSLVATNKAELDGISAWVLGEKLSESELAAEKAAANSKQRFEELQRELKLSASLRESGSNVVYIAAEHLGITVNLDGNELGFTLRHRGTPIYKHYLRLIRQSHESLRRRLLIWQEGLDAQKAIDSLAPFGLGTFETQDNTLVYRQRLHCPSGELVVKFTGSQQQIDADIKGLAEPKPEPAGADDSFEVDRKPLKVTLGGLAQQLRETSRF